MRDRGEGGFVAGGKVRICGLRNCFSARSGASPWVCDPVLLIEHPDWLAGHGTAAGVGPLDE